MGMTFAAGEYVSWGVVSISVANLVMIAVMVVIFVLALVVPFGQGHRAEGKPPVRDDEAAS